MNAHSKRGGVYMTDPATGKSKLYGSAVKASMNAYLSPAAICRAAAGKIKTRSDPHEGADGFIYRWADEWKPM